MGTDFFKYIRDNRTELETKHKKYICENRFGISFTRFCRQEYSNKK